MANPRKTVESVAEGMKNPPKSLRIEEADNGYCCSEDYGSPKKVFEKHEDMLKHVASHFKKGKK